LEPSTELARRAAQARFGPAMPLRSFGPRSSNSSVDESSKQLIKETRTAIPMKSGRPARYDYEYERNGTANLFMMFAPLQRLAAC
jgi:hypothetical protein